MCNSCHDQLRQTVFFEPPHDRGHRPLTGWVTGPDRSLERAGHDGQGDGDRRGPVWCGYADHADDARVHAGCCPAGYGREGRRVREGAAVIAGGS
jgi:hypothetical protein